MHLLSVIKTFVGFAENHRSNITTLETSSLIVTDKTRSSLHHIRLVSILQFSHPPYSQLFWKHAREFCEQEANRVPLLGRRSARSFWGVRLKQTG